MHVAIQQFAHDHHSGVVVEGDGGASREAEDADLRRERFPFQQSTLDPESARRIKYVRLNI